MKKTIWAFCLMSVAMLFLMSSSGVHAAQNSNTAQNSGAAQNANGAQNSNTAQNSNGAQNPIGLKTVKVLGVVSTEQPQVGTVTITVNKASNGLQDQFGKNVTFYPGQNVQVNTCAVKEHPVPNCWSQLSQYVGLNNGKENEAEQRAEIGKINNGDWVFITGYLQANPQRYVATEILKWPSE